MAGEHDVWYSDNLLDEYILELYKKIISKLNEFIEDYTEEEIDLIQIMFIEVNPLPKLKLNNINKLKLNKSLLKIGETKKNLTKLVIYLKTLKIYL